MSSTLFTAPPEWRWLVILYLFVGGLAGGCYFLAVLIDFFGRPADRPLARLAYYVAFPATIVSAMLLTFDLGKPLRFWHMLFQSERWLPVVKPWSPMSLGSWALFAFGLFSAASRHVAASSTSAPRVAAARGCRSSASAAARRFRCARRLV